MAANSESLPAALDTNAIASGTQQPAYAALSAQRQEIVQILRRNWVGPRKSQLASLNEFRHWAPEQVIRLFEDNLPPVTEGSPDKGRKLYPLGPLYRPVPTDSRRWKQLAGKAAMVGALDALAIASSPLLMLASKEQRKQTVKWMSDMNVSVISSSFFIKPDHKLVQQAAASGQALCVNRWGTFQVMGSGYAAISHVWAETMGLEYNDEKIEQDERGFNMHHFIRIMDVVRKTGSEWFWFDLLAIPKGADPETRHLKTQVINTLRHVYANAECIIVLDGLTLQLKSGDPLVTAAILCCGHWLSRVWTYQEAKLARKLKIVTDASVVDFQEIVSALGAAEAADYNRWHELRLTFDRLTPVHDIGISLADIALSCDHRSCENEIDYARGFFALLGLEWKTEFTYDDAMVEILRSRPSQAAWLVNMHGPRGLPAPYSWAPRYLAQLQGRAHAQFDASLGSLLGYWHTITVKSVTREGWWADAQEEVYVCNLVVTSTEDSSDSERDRPARAVQEAEVQIQFYPKNQTLAMREWIETTVPSGKARLLCAQTLQYDFSNQADGHAPIVLAAKDATGPLPDLNLDAWGDVAASAVVNSPSISIPDRRLRWHLS
jgi:hypothetical protein